jgi:outer membrane immunogenic protein
MRAILLATALLFGGASVAVAQESHTGDAAVTYHWVRTNAAPGQCGCFGLNGGGLSGSWNFAGPWSLVTEISTEYTGGALSAGNSLTLTSYLAGARYHLPQLWQHGVHRPQPFAQLLVGAGHAGGGVAGIADASYGFATRMGGGIDVPVSSRFAVRIIQIDYYLTHLPNASNDHQNNLLVGAGIVFHWSRQE